MKYPELTFFDAYKDNGLELVFFVDDLYYHFVFPEILGFITVSNDKNFADDIKFPEGEYMLITKQSAFLDGFKPTGFVNENTLHYAIKCDKITLHIATNLEPVVDFKK